MAYNVSLDFRTVHPILTDEAPAIFEWANIGRVTLTNGGAAFPYGHKVTAMMHGFLTAGNAKSKGDELKSF